MIEKRNDIKYYICCIFDLSWVKPRSKIVLLSSKKYKYWGERYYYYNTKGEFAFIIRSDTQPKLYELLEYYFKGYNLNTRKEKYKHIYMALEMLSNSIELPFRAVRHSLSHSSDKLTDLKVTEYLITNFNDVKIDLNVYKYNKKFQEILRKVGEKCETLIIQILFDLLPEEPIEISKDLLPPLLSIQNLKYYIL